MPLLPFRFPAPSRAASCLVLALLLATSPARAGQAHVDALAHAAADRFIVTYRDGGAQAAAARKRGDDPLRSAARALPARQGRPLRLSRMRRLSSGQEVVQVSRSLDRVEAATLMRQLAAEPGVLRVEVDQRLQPEAVPSDPLLPLQWALAPGSAGINVQPAWDLSDGAGVVVAIIDNGVYPHPDLVPNLLPGYDFLSDETSAADGDGRDPDPTDVGDWAPAGLCGAGSSSTFSSWHGTQVAGIAGASHNGDGIAGVGFRARLLPLRVGGKCGAYTSDILDAIDWASGGSVAGVPANPSPAEVINLSMGAVGACSPSFQAAIDRAVSRGTVFVTAAGNGARDAADEFPGNCQNTITVAASRYDGAKASFSNYGADVDLTAPGQEILTTHVNGPTEPVAPTQRALFGTSMAAPHVAGVVALMQAVARHPLAPARIEAILKATARPMPVACPQGCGAGLLDAGAAVAAARAEPPPAPPPPPPAPAPKPAPMPAPVPRPMPAPAPAPKPTPAPAPAPKPAPKPAPAPRPAPAPAPKPAPAPTPAQKHVTVRGLSANSGISRDYQINVQAGHTLQVGITGGLGDADLYVWRGGQPTGPWLCRPHLSGNEERCSIYSPYASRYYLRVYGFRSFVRVQLDVSY